MISAQLNQSERSFLWALEKIEAGQIAGGEYDGFVKLETVCSQEKTDSIKGLQIAQSLARKRMLLLDFSTGEYLLKSKAASIIKSLYHTTTRVQRRLVHDVSDLKYLRFVKQIPQQKIPLGEKETIDIILDAIGLEAGVEQDVIECGIQAIASQYEKLSGFQLSSAQAILSLLNGKKDSPSIVIVAETGAGKTLAYELPLLLWILNKKIKAYLHKKSGEKAHEAMNCTALLLFPRNVLARDQYDELSAISTKINEKIKKMTIPTDLASFLNISIEKDFGGPAFEERARIYQSCPDIIITNPDTLKRRLMNPLCNSLYKKGIDLVLYDEVHLYYSLFGANVASLNARLQNLLPYSPVFIGMSATIANPQKHCQKLFSIGEQPEIITDREDSLIDFALEHNVIIKPRAGRPALGVCIDTTSCLLHNRHEDIVRAHAVGNDTRPKSLCFVDSLDLAGRWTHDQRNYEGFTRYRAVRTRFRRGYPIHFRPLATQDPNLDMVCNDCKLGSDVIAGNCDEYQRGNCWWFSHDSASFARWLRLAFGVTPNDSIRVKRLTSQEVDLSSMGDIYELFTDRRFDVGNPVPIDALVATSVLEVGVDFKGIKEVIMYGEIRSPTNYKQKAGRGAREGNLADGLFVMTVIPPSPLANFYYRHFYRLVYPSLSPLPLEPRNPDIIRSHAFCSIFDFLSSKSIDVFNVIAAKQDPGEVEKNFNEAISFIRNKRDDVKNFVMKYARHLGHPVAQAEEIAGKAIDNSLHVLESLSSEYEIKGDRKKLVIWAFDAFRRMDVMATLEDDLKANLEKRADDLRTIADSKVSVTSAKNEILNLLSSLGASYSQEYTKVNKLLSTLEGTL